CCRLSALGRRRTGCPPGRAWPTQSATNPPPARKPEAGSWILFHPSRGRPEDRSGEASGSFRARAQWSAVPLLITSSAACPPALHCPAGRTDRTPVAQTAGSGSLPPPVPCAIVCDWRLPEATELQAERLAAPT